MKKKVITIFLAGILSFSAMACGMDKQLEKAAPKSSTSEEVPSADQLKEDIKTAITSKKISSFNEDLIISGSAYLSYEGFEAVESIPMDAVFTETMTYDCKNTDSSYELTGTGSAILEIINTPCTATTLELNAIYTDGKENITINNTNIENTTSWIGYDSEEFTSTLLDGISDCNVSSDKTNWIITGTLASDTATSLFIDDSHISLIDTTSYASAYIYDTTSISKMIANGGKIEVIINKETKLPEKVSIFIDEETFTPYAENINTSFIAKVEEEELDGATIKVESENAVYSLAFSFQ
jgi:hypothetical protein